MLATGTEMFLLIPDAENKRILHPGTVLESDAENVVGEFEADIAPPVGGEMNAFGKTGGGRFFQQAVRVTAIRQLDPRPIIAFKRLGEPISAESRHSFRVSLIEAGVTATIDDEKNCPVVDLSPEGIGLLATQMYRLGTPVTIKLIYGEYELSTLARVQTFKKLGEKRYRYGLLVASKKFAERRTMSKICGVVQRLQLRQRVGTAPKPTPKPAVPPIPDAAVPATSAAASPTSTPPVPAKPAA